MIEMKNLRIIVLSLLIITSSLSGCFSGDDEEEEEKGYEWPERIEKICDSTGSQSNYQLVCEIYLEGNSTPIMTLSNPVEDSIWVVDLSGKIISWNGIEETTVGDLSSIVSRCHNEQGLLGMAFSEDYENTGMVLLSYTENNTCASAKDSNVVLSQAKVENNMIDLATIDVLMEINKTNRNHNGGHVLSIGNNQYLWSIGDGGGSFDPNENGQNRSSKLGTIQLLNYENGTITPVGDNSSEDDYVLHYGLRNPWRFDLDPNGNLWIADVGQNCYEEVNMVPVYHASNFGWSVREGFHDLKEDGGCYENSSEPSIEFTDPLIEYAHENGNCSITGGYWMDWGPQSLRDGYMYGDFCSGNIWIIKNVEGQWVSEEVVNVGTMIVGFGRGINDELLIFSWAGNIYQINEA